MKGKKNRLLKLEAFILVFPSTGSNNSLGSRHGGGSTSDGRRNLSSGSRTKVVASIKEDFNYALVDVQVA